MKRVWTMTSWWAVLVLSSGIAIAQEPADGGEESEGDAAEKEAIGEVIDGAMEGEGSGEAAEESEGDAEGEAVPAADGTTAPPKEGAMGPGKRPLRTDYPGTEEAMRASMETDRIVNGEAPQEIYDLKVRELETRIDDLKDKVFRSKSRIVLLKETLLGNKVAGSKATIVHKKDLGRAFKLQRATFILDNSPIFNELDRNGSLSEKETLELYNGSIGPGTHTLSVTLQYRGSSAVFSYFEGYEFTLRKQCKFTVDEGMATLVDVVSYEKGNAATSLEERPALKCEITKGDVSMVDAKKADEKGEK